MTSKLNLKSVLGLAMGAALVGCASTPTPNPGIVFDCTFPDQPSVEAPAWICDAPVDGVEVSAVGSYQKTKAGIQFQKDQATAAARNALAAQMKVHVKNLLKNYAETTGVGDEETVDTVSSSVTKQLTAATLVGSKRYKSRTSPNGTMYVLVGVDPSAAAANTQQALKTSFNNKRAAWQKFVGEKAHDELEAEFEKIANQDFN